METPALDAVIDFSLVRTIVTRELDRKLTTHGVGLNDFTLLVELYRAPDHRLRRNELAEKLGITTSGVARQLGPLERIGVVDRETSERDARLVLVMLTKAGLRMVDELLELAEDYAGDLLNRHWSEKEQAQLAALSRSVLDRR